MKIICVTGKSGTGKTTFANKLGEELGCKSVKIDKVGHKIYEDSRVLEEIREHFGDKVFTDNKFDRKKLAKIVFTSSKEMDILTDITWKYMEQIIDKEIEKSEKYIVLEWIRLPITKYFEDSYKILLVADEKSRKNMVFERDNISEKELNDRDSASIDFSMFKYDKIVNIDYVDNSTLIRATEVATEIKEKF